MRKKISREGVVPPTVNQSMLIRRAWAIGIVLATVTGHCLAADIEVPRDAQTRLGIDAVQLLSTTHAQAIPAVASVMDATALVALANDLAAAEAATRASSAESGRLAALVAADQSASPREAEAARAQLTADLGRVQTQRAQLGAQYGEEIARLSARDLGALVARLAARETVLLRIDALDGSVTPSGAVRLSCDGDDIDVAGRDFGATPTIEPRLRSIGRFLAVAGTRSPRLAAGAECSATIAGANVDGVLVPETAIVRWNALSWVYVQRGPTAFERRPLGMGQAVADGYLVQDGSLQDAPVVIAGAESLLAAEFGADAADED